MNVGVLEENMELNKVIARLNELYHQSKISPLSEVELEERDRLRRIYLDAIRGQVKAQLDRVKIVDPENADEHVHQEGCTCGCNDGHHH